MIGLAGSLHCAGMCGPLVLAMPAASGNIVTHIFGKLVYNAGRIVTYAALGLLFGAFGQVLGLAGFQRWVSIAAGAAILLSLLALPLRNATVFIARPVNALKLGLGKLLKARSLPAQFSFGVLNGFLPCGLVYVACAAAAATGDALGGARYMAFFGLGTVPMMLGLGLAGRMMHLQFQLRLRKLVPVSLAVMAALLILRGLGLGIPYFSPQLNSVTPAESSCCHPAE